MTTYFNKMLEYNLDVNRMDKDQFNPVMIADLVSGDDLSSLLASSLVADNSTKSDPNIIDALKGVINMLALNWDEVRINPYDMDNSMMLNALVDLSEYLSTKPDKDQILSYINSTLNDNEQRVLEMVQQGLKKDLSDLDLDKYRTQIYQRQKNKQHKMERYLPTLENFFEQRKNDRLNEAKKKSTRQKLADKQEHQKKDITGKKSLASAVKPVMDELNGIIADPRKLKDEALFAEMRIKFLEKVNEPDNGASLKTQQKWTDVINKSRSLYDLAMSMTNMYLKAAGLGVDRGKL